MMAAQNDDSVPVEIGEIVLRLIHQVYYNASLPLPVQPEAFRPTQRDTAGLSVFRERFITIRDVMLGIPAQKRGLYRVARLPVAALATLGLTVQADPISERPGHALIIELNCANYESDKRLWKVVQLQLAQLASNNIVTEVE